jgi:hypothetical protein
MSDQFLSSPIAPVEVDPRATAFHGARINLLDLFRASAKAGGGAAIEGRTFTNCVIEGPAVMLVLEGVQFDGTNFGQTGGDVRNILFRPLGSRGIGAIPVRNCTFQTCDFEAIGITGNDSLLQMLTEQVTIAG